MDEKQQSRGLNISVLWHNFLRVLPRMIWLPLVLGAALGFWRYRQLTKNYVPVYSASSIYRVIANRGGKMDITSYGFYLDSNAASNLASTYPYVMNSDRARTLLRERTGSPSLPASVSCRSETTLLIFQSTGGNPEAVVQALERAADVFPIAAKGLTISFSLETFEEPDRPEHLRPINFPNAESSSTKYAILGFGIGFAIICLLAYFRKTIHNSEDLNKLLNIPCLAVLPKVRFKARTKKNAAVLLTNPYLEEGYAESVRSLRFQLKKQEENQPAKVIMVTSTSPGEGKSTVSANLALSLADQGLKVALVDCDLRKQTLKDLFAVKEKTLGLVDLIPGRNRTPVTDALVQVPDSSLLLLSGDKVAEHPQNFLSANSLQTIINSLRKAMEYVIVDTPPSGLLSDAATLSEWVDGVIYVVRQDYLSHSAILDSVQRLSEADIRFLGSVINQAERNTSRSGYGYGYGYGKGYGYGYGYGYGNKYYGSRKNDDTSESYKK